MLRIDVLTLFPRMLDGVLAESILGKGIASGKLGVAVHDLRAWTTDKHRTADDRPFGGGAGMVMKPEPAIAAIEQLHVVAREPLGADAIARALGMDAGAVAAALVALEIDGAVCREPGGVFRAVARRRGG